MHRSALLLVLTLAACGSKEPAFELADPLSCDVGFVDYEGGLTYAVANGDGSGKFDVDPPGGVETDWKGAYALDSGDVHYDVAYDPEHWRTSTHVDGYGYVEEDGDLDLVGTFTTTDVDGATFTSEIRQQRTGCHQTLRYHSLDDDGNVTGITVEDGDFTADGYDYTRQAVPTDGSDPVVVTGHENPDLTWEQSYAYDDGDVSYTSDATGDGDGYSNDDWTEDTSDFTADGYTESFVDGSWHQHFDYDSSQSTYTWDVTVDYEGNGGGKAKGSGWSCDVTYEDGACSYDCGGGNQGDC